MMNQNSVYEEWATVDEVLKKFSCSDCQCDNGGIYWIQDERVIAADTEVVISLPIPESWDEVWRKGASDPTLETRDRVGRLLGLFKEVATLEAMPPLIVVDCLMPGGGMVTAFNFNFIGSGFYSGLALQKVFCLPMLRMREHRRKKWGRPLEFVFPIDGVEEEEGAFGVVLPIAFGRRERLVGAFFHFLVQRFFLKRAARILRWSNGESSRVGR